MFTPFGYVRDVMAKAYVRNTLAAQFMGHQAHQAHQDTDARSDVEADTREVDAA